MQQQTAVRADGEALVHQVDELTALYRLTNHLYRARSLHDIHDAALEAILGTLGCSRASLLLFDEAGVMQFVGWRGLSDSYRAAVKGHSPWNPKTVDPDPIFIGDIDLADEPEWLKARIKAEGIRALAFIPLIVQGALIGKFMTYYDRSHAFAPHEIDLAVTIARQIGFALERAGAEQARRAAEAELRESEERFRLMSENAPVMIWMSHPDGSCLHLNRMLRAFWKVEEEQLATFDWQRTLHPEDAPEIARLMTEAIAAQANVRLKGRYLNAEGRYRVLETNAQPRFSPKGEYLGMIGVNVDITEREQTERELRDSEERFRLAVEAAPSGMIMADAEGRIVMVNAQAAKLFGYGRGELVGQPVDLLVPPRYQQGHPQHRANYHRYPAARPMGDGRELFARRKDGTEMPVEISLSSMKTAKGIMTLAAVVDIGSRKRADAQRELLLAELNHRVKNTLAVVQGIARQTFRASNASSEARKAFEGRLFALSVAHSLLTRSNWEDASLEQLATDTLKVGIPNQARVALSGPPVVLPPKEAVAIVLALHELCTNAVKYGALSNDTGRIDLGWSRSDDEHPRLKLVWREHGGPLVSPPEHRGFGSFLLERTLAQDLDGSVTAEFRPEGLVCSIDAPLPNQSGSPR